MLSNYERRVLNEIELDLTRMKCPRSKLRAAIRSLRLPVALMALGASMSLSTGDQLPRWVGAVLVAAFGVLVGWLLLGAIRRRVWGPRLRGQLRRRLGSGSAHSTENQ